MSRAFVKELDGDEHPETLPPRLVSPHPNYVTPQGLEQLDRQIAELKAEWRKLRKAETLESRRQLAEVQRDLDYFQNRRESALLVPVEAHPEAVRFGGTVTVAEDEDERTFSIVGEDEADPEQGRVSWTSPLAKAVHGARVGDLRIWQRPKGNLELEILEIAEITCP